MANKLGCIENSSPENQTNTLGFSAFALMRVIVMRMMMRMMMAVMMMMVGVVMMRMI